MRRGVGAESRKDAERKSRFQHGARKQVVGFVVARGDRERLGLWGFGQESGIKCDSRHLGSVNDMPLCCWVW